MQHLLHSRCVFFWPCFGQNEGQTDVVLGVIFFAGSCLQVVETWGGSDLLQPDVLGRASQDEI